MASRTPSMSFILGTSRSTPKPKAVRAQSEKAIHDLVLAKNNAHRGIDSASVRTLEGFLWIRIHSRRLRYCVLEGRTLLVYNSKEDAALSNGCVSPSAKKKIVVVGVKDAVELDKHMSTLLLGSASGNGNVENALVVSTEKSKLVAVEAETHTEKQRWFHALNCLNFASPSTERALFLSMLQDSGMFDAHMAVTLLHRYRDNDVAAELVIDRLAEYAEHHIDDVEFYIQQIMHLVVNMELAKTEKLVNLLLSICKACAYVEHLGNCIHLALQLFWLLEAKIQDNDPKSYNKCAKLLMSIEAKIVNQQFELPPASCSPESVSKMLLQIPGMKQRLAEMKENAASAPYCSETTTAKTGSSNSEATANPTNNGLTESPEHIPNDEEAKLHRALLMQWMEKERQKRYKFFHEQRDFVKALADISEHMRLIEPPQERKKHLPTALAALNIPAMAYIPLGRVSDPYSRITRVLKDEGTVFSTHSRAPCLLCFEVVQDQVNAAGHRASMTQSRLPQDTLSPRRSSTLTARGSITSISSSVMSIADEEAEVLMLLKKYSINGRYVAANDVNQSDPDEPSDASNQPSDSVDDDVAALRSLEHHLGVISIATGNDSSVQLLGVQDSDSASSGSLELSPRTATIDIGAPTTDDESSLMRRRSKTTYEQSLSKLLSESGVFGESWSEKKARIRAASPFGQLPGWNVISLISKSNDDIRQEVFAMQLITKFQDIFQESGLPLWLRAYRIISTGKTSGLIETITDAQSLDGLKKKDGYESLLKHFEREYGQGDVKAFKAAQRNFLHSLAAYSLVCYLLQIKDRHNGNILVDTAGHLIHIDFGFMLGIAPGGTWSLETAPFKLTKEMVEVLGGVESKLFGEFVHLLVLGLLAAQRNAEKIITLVEIMMRNSTFPCFQGRDVSKDLQKLRERFMLHHSTEQVVKAVIKMVSVSYKNKWTKRYDQFQKLTNGILP